MNETRGLIERKQWEVKTNGDGNCVHLCEIYASKADGELCPQWLGCQDKLHMFHQNCYPERQHIGKQKVSRSPPTPHPTHIYRHDCILPELWTVATC